MKFILPIFSGVLATFSAHSQVQVLSEDFTGGIPSTWTITIADTNHVDTAVYQFAPGWIGLQDPLDNTNFIAGATSYFRFAGTANRWLITPKMQLGAYGNMLKWRARSHDPSYSEDYQVRISTSDSATTSFNDTLIAINLELEDWTEHEINLSELGYNSQDVYIAFVLKTYDGFKFYLDDVNVRKDDPLAINENANQSVFVYPNPSADFISVKGNATSLRLVSLAGTTVLSKAISPNEKIDVSALTSGTYIAEVTTSEGILRQKIVKK